MEKEIKVIGFYTHTNELYLYNDWDDRFDGWSKVDLNKSAFKYTLASMLHAEICMKMEGNVGKLEEIILEC